MNKNTVIAIVVVILLLGGGIILSRADKKTADPVSIVIPDDTQQEVNKIPDGIYAVSTTESNLEWVGKKILIDKKHIGVVPVSEGAIEIKDNSIVDGQISLDILSLSVDPEDESKEQLEKHLKSPDFIDTVKYPNASFVVSSVSFNENNKTVLTGDLDLNGIKNQVSIPVDFDYQNNVITISGSTVIDRTLWSINFGSGKIFDKLGDTVIDDNVEISFLLKAVLADSGSTSGNSLETKTAPEVVQ